MAISLVKTPILQFPRDAAEDTWVKELEDVIQEGVKDDVINSFIGFALMKDGESGVHVGMLDLNNKVDMYILLGALEMMKTRLMDALNTEVGEN